MLKPTLTTAHATALRDLNELTDWYSYSFTLVIPDPDMVTAPVLQLTDPHANVVVEQTALLQDGDWYFGSVLLHDEEYCSEGAHAIGREPLRRQFAAAYSGAIFEAVENVGLTEDEIRMQFRRRHGYDLMTAFSDAHARDAAFVAFIDELQRSHKITSHRADHTTLSN